MLLGSSSAFLIPTHPFLTSLNTGALETEQASPIAVFR